jgi:hypothetical protein
MSFWTSTLRKRRKPHRCATCGQVVAAGEHSYDESGLCDGEFNAFRQCRACNDIVRYFFCAVPLTGTVTSSVNWRITHAT